MNKNLLIVGASSVVEHHYFIGDGSRLKASTTSLC